MNSSKRALSPEVCYYYCETIDESIKSASNSPIRSPNQTKRKRLETLSEQTDENPPENSNFEVYVSEFLLHKQPTILEDLPIAFTSTCDEKSFSNNQTLHKQFLSDIYDKLNSYLGENFKIYSPNELEFLDPNYAVILNNVTNEVAEKYPKLFQTKDAMMNEVDRYLEKKARAVYLDLKFIYSKLSNIKREDCINENLFKYSIALNACLKIYLEDCFYQMKSFEEILSSNKKKLEIIKKKIATSTSKMYLFEQSLAINKAARERELQELLERGVDLTTYRQFDKSNVKQIIIDLTLDPFQSSEKSAEQGKKDILTDFENILIL